MEKLMKYIFRIFVLCTGTMVWFSSCDRQVETYLVGKHRFKAEEENDGYGISFVMESDSLEEEIEEVYFEAKE